MLRARLVPIVALALLLTSASPFAASAFSDNPELRATQRGNIYVINAADDTVLVIDGKWTRDDGERVSKATVTKTIEGFDEAADLAVSDDYVWVANQGRSGTVAKIDRTTHEIVDEFKIGRNVRSIELIDFLAIPGARRAPSPKLAVLHGKRNVRFIDPETGERLGEVKVSKNPVGVRGDWFSGMAFTYSSNGYSIIDADEATSRLSGASGGKTVINSKQKLCEIDGKRFGSPSSIRSIASTIFNLFYAACTGFFTGGRSAGGVGNLVFVTRGNPSAFFPTGLGLPTTNPIDDIVPHFEEFFPEFGPSIPAFFFTENVNGNARAGTRYSIWNGGDVLDMGNGGVLAHNVFADTRDAARAGDRLMVGPLNCPNPSNAKDPFCSSAGFFGGLKAVSKVPSDANFTKARLEPDLIPLPPFDE